jgi:hypothetical protein
MLDRVGTDSVMQRGLDGLVPHQYQAEVFVRAQKGALDFIDSQEVVDRPW